MRKVGEIWWGKSERPGDFYRKDTGKYKKGDQKIRPFLITKINNDGTVRVVEGSTSIRKNYQVYKVKINNFNYMFDPAAVYNLPAKNLRKFAHTLFSNSNSRKQFNKIQKTSDRFYFSCPEKAEYERKLQTGELAKMSAKWRQKERQYYQFPEHQRKAMYNPKILEERKILRSQNKSKIRPPIKDILKLNQKINPSIQTMPVKQSNEIPEQQSNVLKRKLRIN